MIQALDSLSFERVIELVRTSRLLQALILFSFSGFFLRMILCFGFGFRVGLINPFLMKISNLGLDIGSVKIKIRTIRFNFSISKMKFSIILDDIYIKIKDKEKEKVDPIGEYARFKDQNINDLDPNTPIYIFPKSFLLRKIVEVYLLYFRFVGFHYSKVTVELEKLGVTTKISHILSEVSIHNDGSKRSFVSTLRLFHQSINGIEIFDSFTVGVSGYLDFHNGEVSKLNLEVEMRNFSIPVLSIIKTIPKRENKTKPIIEYGTQEFCDYSLARMNKKLYHFCYFIKLINKIDIGFQSFAIKEIPLGDMNQIQSSNYEPLVKFELKINAFALAIQRMYFDSPGYGLLYKYEDKPFHMIYNFTEVSLFMSSPHKEIYKPIITIPVLNFTGSSNVFFQTLKASKKHIYTDGKLLVTGHLSDLIIDLSVEDITNLVLAALDFLKVKKRSDFEKKSVIPPSRKSTNSFFWMKIFPKLWPIVDLKFSIENPIFVVKSALLEQFYRILVLRFSSISIQLKTTRKIYDCPSYSLYQFVSLANAVMKFKDTRDQLNATIMKLDSIDLKQTIDILPKLLVCNSFVSESTLFDVSNLEALHGVNASIADLYYKITPLIEQYREETCDCCIRTPQSEIDSCDDSSTIVEETFADMIPEWLTKVAFVSNNTSVIMGSRSLLIPKHLMKDIEPLAENDLINGELRKVEIFIEQWAVTLLSQIGRTDLDSFSSSASSLEDDDKGLMDSLPESHSIKESWNLRLESSKILGKIHSERSQDKNTLGQKIFMKIPSTKLTISPYADNLNQLAIDYHLDKVDMFYSVITHFIIISCLHLLRNTVLEFLQYGHKNSPIQGQQVEKKKSVNIKNILDKIHVSFSIDYLELIFVFPDKLKLKLEINRANMFAVHNKPILLDAHYLRVCAESPTTTGYWARILTAVNGSTVININEILDKVEDAVWIDTSNESFHLTIPHQFIIYKVFDNISVTVKTLKQLHHSLKYNTDEFVINPHAKPAIKIPKSKLRSGRLFFSMEDDPFETELNMIFQIGLSEQKMRFEKTKLFDARIAEELQNNRQKSPKVSTFPNSYGHAATSDFSIKSKRKKFAKNRTTSFTPARHSQSLDAIFSSKRETKSEQGVQTNHTPDFNNMFPIQEKALEKLHILREGFSKSWIARVRAFKKNQEREFQQNFKYLWGNLNLDHLPKDFNRKVLDFVTAPSIFSLILEGVDMELSKPSFGVPGIPDFVYDVGKGKSKDSEYSTLIPFHMDLKLGELRCHLRDYPLPFIYMPRVNSFTHSKLPAVRIHGDVVVGENTIQSHKEVREVYVPLVPGCDEFDKDDKYSIEVPKTLTSIKFYTKLDFDLNSSKTTKATWGTSYQPCIQQIMLNLDNFTKPPIDPSDKVGFWDKLRANFHARLHFNWTQGGRFDVLFKGTKNPYDICGNAAGFILGFGKDVVLNINEKDDPKEFLVANSHDLIFAVPNHIAEPLLVWSRETERSVFLANQSSNFQSSTYGYYFDNTEIPNTSEVEIMSEHYLEKVVVRLSGGVQFNLSLFFERKMEDGLTRTSEFVSHDEIVLVNPKYVEDRDSYDAYTNFRSQFIHMGITLLSHSESAYNTIQLTPRTFQHFFAWWHMFSNTYPVRHGKLFGPEKITKKFARHLFTIKYQAITNPLFISHVYHDQVSETEDQDKFVAVGMKARASSFILDLHQRKETFHEHNHNLGVTKKIMKMGFNIGQIRMTDLDLRTINGTFELDRDLTVAKRRASGIPNGDNHGAESIEGDKSWFDVHDFTEICTSSLDGYKCSAQINPMMYTPSMMYAKKNDHGDRYQIDFETGKKIKPFGNETSHDCLARDHNSTSVQKESFSGRLQELLAKREEKLNEIAEMKSHESSHNTPEKRRQIDQMSLEIRKLEHGIKLVEEISLAYESRAPEEVVENSSFDFVINDNFDTSPFKNKFIIHDMHLKWNVTNRDVVYRYVYLFELRREFSRYIQHRALTQIDAIIEAQERRSSASRVSRVATHMTQATYESRAVSEQGQDQACRSVAETRASEKLKNFSDEFYDLSVDLSCIVQENYMFKLVTPQIQLQSEEDEKSVVLIVAPNIELKVLAFDINETENEYNENIVEQRFGAVFTDASAFVFFTDERQIRENLLFSNSTYGSDGSWPPWLGVELCYDGSVLKNNILMEKTSVILRYDKPDESFFVNDRDNSINKLSCDLSEAVFRCDARQYYSLYTMIMDLLIYNEPRNRKLKEKESKMLLRLDVKDISSLKERILQQQESIKQMIRIENNLAGRRSILDDVERNDLVIVANKRNEAIVEIFLLMRVALLGGRQSESSDDFLEWNIRADEIKLHMLDEERQPFLDALLTNSHFKRIEGSDRSDSNIIAIESVEVFNLEKDAELPVLFAPYEKPKNNKKSKVTKPHIIREERLKPMIHVSWRMDNPVGGIRVIRKFEVDLEPLQLNIDQVTGDKVMKYAFPDSSPLLSKNGYDLEENGGSRKTSLHKESKETLTSKTSSNLDTRDLNEEAIEDIDGDIEEINGNGNGVNHINGNGTSNGDVTRTIPTIEINNNSNSVRSGSEHQVSPRKSMFSFRSNNDSSMVNGSSQSNGSLMQSSRQENDDVDDQKEDDELEEMIRRASNYLSIVSFRFKSCVISITYRGHGAKRLINVSDFAFTLPEMIFTNQTWTLLDLTMEIKKLVVKALLSHTGSIIGNKLAQHKRKRVENIRDIGDYASSRMNSFRSN